MDAECNPNTENICRKHANLVAISACGRSNRAMVHMGATLKAIAHREQVAIKDLAAAAKIDPGTVYDWLAAPFCRAKGENFERVLTQLGHSPASFLRAVGASWDGSRDADIRLEIIEAIEHLGGDELRAAYDAARAIRAATAAEQLVDEASAERAPASQADDAQSPPQAQSRSSNQGA